MAAGSRHGPRQTFKIKGPDENIVDGATHTIGQQMIVDFDETFQVMISGNRRTR